LVRTCVDSGATSVLRRSAATLTSLTGVSEPEPVTWQNSSGLEVHGFLYSPTSERFCGEDSELPPLIVHCHGGPTMVAAPVYSIVTQYWTSRGYAMLDVNYGGSWGFGRAYRDRLDGKWGVVDVDDVATGAVALAREGRVDGARMAVRGGSGGGYTALAALTFTNAFRAAAIHCGSADLERWIQTIPTFERGYFERLIAPYPAKREIFLERSPIHHLERIAGEVALFQGADDPMVPRQQAEVFADEARQHGVGVELHVYAGEGHGFRNAATIEDVYRAETAFYERIFSLKSGGRTR
jgi:dipeptidyl aminopeptidase/acylaminoacyl peptidase